MALTDCAIQSGYTKNCRDSVGGIKTLYLTELSNKASITQASGVISAFTLTSGKKFYKFEMTQATGTASSDPQPAEANGSFFWDQKIALQIPKRLASFSYQIRTLAVQDLMGIVEDQNGEFWLFGELNGLKMKPGTGSFGTAMADVNGWVLNWGAMEKEDVKQVSSNLITALTTPA